MTIRHDHTVDVGDDEAFVFAHFMEFTSVCAPSSWDIGKVIAFTEGERPSRDGWRWVSVDKSKLIMGMGTPTPNPCNHQPNHRIHYFMMRAEG